MKTTKWRILSQKFRPNKCSHSLNIDKKDKKDDDDDDDDENDDNGKGQWKRTTEKDIWNLLQKHSKAKDILIGNK